MYVKLRNKGESNSEINWGQAHMTLKPGQESFNIAEAIANKFILRDPNLEIVRDNPSEVNSENSEVVKTRVRRRKREEHDAYLQ